MKNTSSRCKKIDDRSTTTFFGRAYVGVFIFLSLVFCCCVWAFASCCFVPMGGGERDRRSFVRLSRSRLNGTS